MDLSRYYKAHFAMLWSIYRYVVKIDRLNFLIHRITTLVPYRCLKCYKLMYTKMYILAHLSIVFCLTGWCPKHWIDSWKWCCWCNCSADNLHIPWPGVHSHWLLCEQWIHRPRASWKSTDQARLHTGQTNGWYLDNTFGCQNDCLMLILLFWNNTLDYN